MPSALSISSHVVHGYVGNRAMVFPLQYAGWDVDALNTTNYSNHPGYGKFKGTKTTSDQISDLIEGLEAILNVKTDYELIITGYTPTEEGLNVIFDRVSSIYRSSPSSSSSSSSMPLWILDPVLGDNGKLYVLEGLVPIYETILKSGYVSLITPNLFEFETLVGVKIDSSLESLKLAVEKFSDKFPKIPYLVISSVAIGDKMYSVGYNKGTAFYIEVDEIECSFSGCGDLFTALLSIEIFNDNPSHELTPKVLGTVLVKLHKILQHTFESEKVKLKGAPFTNVKDLSLISLRQVLTDRTQQEHDVKYL